MPYRRRTFRKRRRPTYRRRRTAKRRRRGWRMRRPILEGFAKQKLCKLRYIEEITINPAMANFAVHEFRANSVYDPNATGVGHQPMGFDQWSGIYQRYCVLGSRIIVQNTNSTNASVNTAYFGVTVYGVAGQLTSTYGSTVAVMESKLTGRTRVIAGNANASVWHQILSRKFSSRRFFGKKDVIDDPDLGATVLNNPINQAYFGIWAGGVQLVDSPNLEFKVTIDYIVMFHEPYLIGQS